MMSYQYIVEETFLIIAIGIVLRTYISENKARALFPDVFTGFISRSLCDIIFSLLFYRWEDTGVVGYVQNGTAT